MSGRSTVIGVNALAFVEHAKHCIDETKEFLWIGPGRTGIGHGFVNALKAYVLNTRRIFCQCSRGTVRLFTRQLFYNWKYESLPGKYFPTAKVSSLSET